MSARQRQDTVLVVTPTTRVVTGPTSNKRASADPRLPIQPLVRLIAAQGGLAACGVRHQPGDAIGRVRWVARLERAYARARHRGWISLHTGDEIAVKALMRHPSEIWGADWWDE